MQDIQPLYSWIVDSVVAKSRTAFLQDGVDESVLEELKARWEAKLQASDLFKAEDGEMDADAGPKRKAGAAANKGADASIATADAASPVGGKRQKTDAEAALAEPVSAAAADAAPADVQTAAPVAANGDANAQGQSHGALADAPSTSRAGPSASAQVAAPSADAAVGPDAGSSVADGAAASPDAAAGEAATDAGPAAQPVEVGAVAPAARDIDELDGSDVEVDDDAIIADEEAGGDTVLALYDKVSHTKDKWKLQLRQGIVSINDREYVFGKATVDLKWDA